MVDNLLLEVLSNNKRDLVISFTNLAVGGAYLPPTSDGRLLTAIYQDMENGMETIEVGGANNDSDIIVDVEGGVVNSSVQITVYNGNQLFRETNCTNSSSVAVGGDIVGPIISVISKGASPNNDNNEIITITYNRLSNEETKLVCAQWISNSQCKR